MKIELKCHRVPSSHVVGCRSRLRETGRASGARRRRKELCMSIIISKYFSRDLLCGIVSRSKNIAFVQSSDLLDLVINNSKRSVSKYPLTKSSKPIDFRRCPFAKEKGREIEFSCHLQNNEYCFVAPRNVR